MGVAKKVVAVLDDLFFLAKIQDAAKRVNLEVEFVRTPAQALEKAAQSPDLIVLDLNCKTTDPLQLIPQLKKAAPGCPPKLMGFVSHVETELRRNACQLGCDVVFPRSAFSANLPKLLLSYASCSETPS
jgi:CheY-like chemotaxis protein